MNENLLVYSLQAIKQSQFEGYFAFKETEENVPLMFKHSGTEFSERLHDRTL